MSVFNGDILQWQTFWDSFESISYLKTQIEANAARTIDGYIKYTIKKS